MNESDPACAAKGIPQHLHRVGRPADHVFQDTEFLYRRFRIGEPDPASAISFNRMSVNREKFCNSADDTLWNDKDGGRHEGYGVIKFPVGALNLKKKHPQEDFFFSLKPEHHPEDCNYSHSEVTSIKILEDGSEEALSEIRPKSVKLAIRKALRDAISVVLNGP